MKILFACKSNMFRSQIAKSYFNKINKNKKNKAESAGIFHGDYPLEKVQIKLAKKFGIIIKDKPKAISLDLLRKSDKIIIVADNVLSSIFQFKNKKTGKKFIRKIVRWEIEDEENGNKKNIEKIIKKIMRKVENLVKQLNKT